MFLKAGGFYQTRLLFPKGVGEFGYVGTLMMKGAAAGGREGSAVVLCSAACLHQTQAVSAESALRDN